MSAKGKVMLKEEKVVDGPLIVKFKTDIAANGELVRVTLHQFGQMIQLTALQAIALAEQIRDRIV